MRSREHYEAAKAARLAIAQQKRENAEQEAVDAKFAQTSFWRHTDKLVRYSGWLQAYTLVLSLGTIALFIATGVSALILHNTDSAIRGQLDEMKAMRRPWVHIVSAEITKFRFDKDGLDVGVDYVLHNTGNTPALRSFLGTQAYPFHFVGYFDQMKKDCAESEKYTDLFGVDNFPNENKRVSSTGKITITAIKHWINQRNHDQNPEKKSEKQTLPEIISPTIVGCILYVSPSDQIIHRTLFSYTITRESDPNILVQEGQPPLSEMRLDPWIPLGAHAD